MKLATVALTTFVAANEKKVPHRTPEQRLKTLRRFANEWTAANLNAKQAANFANRYQNNADRMLKKYNRCGYYNDQLQHGGPRPAEDGRKRRNADDEATIDTCEPGSICRYDQQNPVRGLQQITRGYQKWCERYIADCGVKGGRNPLPFKVMSDRFGTFQKKLLELITPDQ